MESYKIQLTERSINDLRENYAYIANILKEPVVANKWQTDIEESIRSLVHMPQRHSIIDDESLSKFGYRKLLINNHIIFYFINKEEKIVTIARILYARRDLLNIL